MNWIFCMVMRIMIAMKNIFFHFHDLYFYCDSQKLKQQGHQNLVFHFNWKYHKFIWQFLHIFLSNWRILNCKLLINLIGDIISLCNSIWPAYFNFHWIWCFWAKSKMSHRFHLTKISGTRVNHSHLTRSIIQKETHWWASSRSTCLMFHQNSDEKWKKNIILRMETWAKDRGQ